MNKGKICVSVCAETVDEFIEKIERAEKLGELIELRFDCLDKNEFDSTSPPIKNFNENYIFTYRPKEQGGKRELTLDEREGFWNSGFDFCGGDFEEDLVENHLYWLYGPIICSHHDFEGVPSNLIEIYERIKSAEANVDIIKIAVQANDITDSLEVWKLLEKTKKVNAEKPKKYDWGLELKIRMFISRISNNLLKYEPKRFYQVIPIAMGEAGKWTRILGLAFGSPITYASLEEGNETAPGQISAKDLIEVYRVKELNEQTEIYGIIGNPVSHSLSPYMHNAAFKYHNLNAVYIPFEVANLDKFIKRMVREETREIDWNLKGFSVTIPHKEAIIKHLDFIEEEAKTIGAVNTVQIVAGKLYGYNTDAHGFIEPLRNYYSNLKDINVGIIGNGGAARSCIYALKKEGANVTVFARNVNKAKSLADEFSVRSSEFRIGQNDFGKTDILINSSPLGMKDSFENETPTTAEQIKNIHLAYDLVYNPIETLFLREAKSVDIPTIGGLDMLVAQGMQQFKIWTGREAPMQIMNQAALQKLK